MTDERYQAIMAEWRDLKSLLKEVEFNDIDYKNMFNEIDGDALFYFAYLTKCNAEKDEFNDIAYVEQVKGILETINKKQTISYKQFRVLCFFYKRVLYRSNNPIKLQSK
jgi:hypothetical protein